MNLSDFNSYDSVKSTIIWTEADFQAALNFIAANELLGFDLETDGVNPRKNSTIGIGISNLTEGFYLPLFFWDGEKLEVMWPKDRAQQFLKALEGKKLLAYNGGFEMGFCRHNFAWEFVEHFYSDQMLMLHLLNENLFTYGLKDRASVEFGDWAVHAQQLMLASVKANGGSEKEYYKSDMATLGHYCVWDCALTVAMYLRDQPKLEQQGLSKFFFEDETMPFYKHVNTELELNGILVDLPLLESSLSAIKVDLSNLEAHILTQISPHLGEFQEWFMGKEYPAKRTGPFAQAVVELLEPDNLPRTPAGDYSLAAKGVAALPDGLLKNWLQLNCYLPDDVIKKAQAMLHGDSPAFNLLSTDHQKRLFFQKLKEKPFSYTPKGAPQVDEDFLQEMAKKYQWAAELQTFRRLTKICGTYFQRVYDSLEDGRFYPTYFYHRTKTGRQSGDLQQLPRVLTPEDEPNETIRKYNNVIRALFIADPGYKILDADYSGLEVVVFADDAGDEALLDLIRNDGDLYSEVARGSFGLEQYSSDKKADNYLKKHRPKERQDSKAFALGFRYGEDPYKLHMETGWEKEKCIEIQRNYFAAYPKLRNRMDELILEVCTKGYVQSKFGRRRRQYEAVGIYQQHGLEILDSLQLWKKFHSEPVVYDKMKMTRKKLKSIINAALNFPIQSAASSIVSRAAVKLALWVKKYHPKAKIIAVSHDQVYLHVPESDTEFVKTNMKRIMETTTLLSVPLTADPQIANNLRDGH